MIAAQPMPSIDYENYIIARSAQMAGQVNTAPDSERGANLLQTMQEQILHWTAIGNQYADMLESDATAPEQRAAVHAELEALEEAAGSTFATTEPALIRMLYPLLRDLAAQRQKEGPAVKSVCAKCYGTGTEVVPGKGARACSCRRRHRDGVVDLRDYRAEKAERGGQKQSDCEPQETDRVQREVDGVCGFFEGYAPDFITEVVVDAICEACARLGIEEPTYEDDREARATLQALFSKTRMLSLRSNGLHSAPTSAGRPVITTGETPA